MNLHIVSHCWRYPRLLCYQLSSLVMHPPQRVHTICTVFHALEDTDTVDMLAFFRQQRTPSTILWDFRTLPPENLCRRAIGRNHIAKTTPADWVWFADCDYVFGEGCIDAMPEQLASVDGPLAFPRIAHRSKTHELGDWAIRQVDWLGLRCVLPEDYTPYTNRRAIGGIQIARGDVCREKGYLDGHAKFQRPAKRWRRTHCDTAFRRSIGSRGQAIHLPNLYHIRHSQRGRKDVGVEL